MGAWGLDVFENDSAMDWIYELTESSGLSAIQQALSAVVNADDYIEVDEGSVGLAAIEVVNVFRGKNPNNVPEDVINWVSKNSSYDVSGLVAIAKQAIEKIDDSENSEVAGLWLDEGYDWAGMVSDIKARLNA